MMCKFPVATVLMAVTIMFCLAIPSVSDDIFKSAGEIAISLPAPVTDGPVSVERAISERRAVGSFASAPLDLQQVSQILWAAQGTTGPSQESSPVDIYLVAKSVKAIQSRIYKYQPKTHKLILDPKDDSMDGFYEAVSQKAADEAPACLVITVNPGKTEAKTGGNAGKWAYMEAGHVAQNVCLEAIAMELSTSAIGSFNAGKVRKSLVLPKGEEPVYVMPIGKGK